MHKSKGPPDLDKYLEEKAKVHDLSASRQVLRITLLGIRESGKGSQSYLKLRKTAIVDTVVFDKYLEEHCVVTEDEDVIYETEEMDMPRARKEIKTWRN